MIATLVLVGDHLFLRKVVDKRKEEKLARHRKEMFWWEVIQLQQQQLLLLLLLLLLLSAHMRSGNSSAASCHPVDARGLLAPSIMVRYRNDLGKSFTSCPYRYLIALNLIGWVLAAVAGFVVFKVWFKAKWADFTWGQRTLIRHFDAAKATQLLCQLFQELRAANQSAAWLQELPYTVGLQTELQHIDYLCNQGHRSKKVRIHWLAVRGGLTLSSLVEQYVLSSAPRWNTCSLC